MLLKAGVTSNLGHPDCGSLPRSWLPAQRPFVGLRRAPSRLAGIQGGCGVSPTGAETGGNAS